MDDMTARRFAFVEKKALRLVAAAGLKGAEAESVRQAVHANYKPLVQQFEDNNRMAGAPGA
jgi:hypothetical protein